MSEPNQCPSCGSATNPGSRFCFACGARLDATAEPTAPAAPLAPSGGSQVWVESQAPGFPGQPAAFQPPAPPVNHQAQFDIPAQPGVWSAASELVTPPAGSDPASVPGQGAKAAPPVPQGLCYQHAGVPAIARCATCGVGVCETCDFMVPAAADSSSILGLGTQMHICPNCAATRGRPGAPLAQARPARPPIAIPLGAGIMCFRHPEVAAVRHCYVCQRPMCQTCQFELPGYFFACPDCATNPKRKMSSGRKRNIIIAYAAAAWTSIGLIALFAVAFAGIVRTKSDQEALGTALSFLVFLPSLAGIGFSISSIDRKLGTPPAVWVAVIWNGIILGILVTLTIIGNLK